MNNIDEFVEGYSEKLYMVYSSMDVDKVFDALETSLPKTEVERESFNNNIYRRARYKATKKILREKGILF